LGKVGGGTKKHQGELGGRGVFLQGGMGRAKGSRGEGN